MRTPTIVVAVDGAASTESTVRWAAHEAARRQRDLHVVHVLEWDWNAARYDFGGDHFAMARGTAENVTATAASAARAVAPAVEVTEVTPAGSPAAILLATAADDSEAVEHVLSTAFAAAAARGTGVVAVRSYVPVIPQDYATYVATAVMSTAEQEAAERARLAEQLHPWRTKYPDVPVETVVSRDGAAGLLVGASHDAQLVVVGSRGHGVIVGTLLGSTGLQLLHHADCPVYLDRQRKHT